MASIQQSCISDVKSSQPVLIVDKGLKNFLRHLQVQKALEFNNQIIHAKPFQNISLYSLCDKLFHYIQQRKVFWLMRT